VLILLVAAAAAQLAAPAEGRIVLQRSIAGIRIGMTKTQVRNALGRPRRAQVKRNNFGLFAEWRYPKLFVRFQGNSRVTSVSTSRKTERTRGGLGVGTTKQELKARGLRCRTLFGANYCYLGVIKPGRRVTTFYLSGTRVASVLVGIVID
jgi:hypothetical protein